MSSQQKVQDLSGTPLRIQALPTYPTSPCKRCGVPGHFSIACYVKRDKDGNPIETDSEPEYTSE